MESVFAALRLFAPPQKYFDYTCKSRRVWAILAAAGLLARGSLRSFCLPSYTSGIDEGCPYPLTVAGSAGFTPKIWVPMFPFHPLRGTAASLELINVVMFSQPPTIIILIKKIDPDLKLKRCDARILGLQMLGTIKLFKPAAIIISNRFCGPTYKGHEGSTAGTLAQYFSGLIEVKIKKPFPMDHKMALVAWKDWF